MSPDVPVAADVPADAVVRSCLDLLDDHQLRGLMRHVNPRSDQPAEVPVARCLLDEALARKLGPASLRARLVWRD